MQRFAILFSAIAIILVSGCSITSAGERERMLIIASSLTKLTKAVESTVRYKNPPSGIADGELLKLSTLHDPGLLAPFAEYKVLAKSENRHAIVLVCTADGMRGLLEDVGCSANLDSHLWELQIQNNCEFILSVEDVCKN